MYQFDAAFVFAFLLALPVFRFLAVAIKAANSPNKGAGMTSTLSSTSSSVELRFNAAGNLLSTSTKTCTNKHKKVCGATA